MNKIALVAALPFALTLAACGEAAEETDTTAMETQAVEPMDDTMMADDAMMADDTMADDTMMADDVETDPMTMEPVETQ